MVPILTVTGGVPVLPPVIAPTRVCTEPATSVVLLSGVSLYVTPVAAVLPVLRMVTSYRIVSPGEATPFLSASTNKVACLVAASAGCTASGVIVGSPGEGAPLLSASTCNATAFSAESSGADVSGVTVGSPGVSVFGSSVLTGGTSLLLTVPWFTTRVTPAANGLSTWTRKVI